MPVHSSLRVLRCITNGKFTSVTDYLGPNKLQGASSSCPKDSSCDATRKTFGSHWHLHQRRKLSCKPRQAPQCCPSAQGKTGSFLPRQRLRGKERPAIPAPGTTSRSGRLRHAPASAVATAQPVREGLLRAPLARPPARRLTDTSPPPPHPPGLTRGSRRLARPGRSQGPDEQLIALLRRDQRLGFPLRRHGGPGSTRRPPPPAFRFLPAAPRMRLLRRATRKWKGGGGGGLR